jgi:hypothetical protein
MVVPARRFNSALYLGFAVLLALAAALAFSRPAIAPVHAPTAPAVLAPSGHASSSTGLQARPGARDSGPVSAPGSTNAGSASTNQGGPQSIQQQGGLKDAGPDVVYASGQSKMCGPKPCSPK